MALISPADASKVADFFRERLATPVTIDLFTEKKSLLFVPGRRECEYCEETEHLLAEVAALSDQIQLNIHDLRNDPSAGEAFGIDAAMVPAFVLGGGARGRARFFGIPAGYEFASLLQNLADVSTAETTLSAATKESLQGLAADVHIRVFVTPT